MHRLGVNSAPLGARLKLCEGGIRLHRIRRAIIIIDTGFDKCIWSTPNRIKQLLMTTVYFSKQDVLSHIRDIETVLRNMQLKVFYNNVELRVMAIGKTFLSNLGL